MKRLLIGLFCVSVPFLALYGAVSCFFPKQAVKDIDSAYYNKDKYNTYINNPNEEEDVPELSDIEKKLLLVVLKEFH